MEASLEGLEAVRPRAGRRVRRTQRRVGREVALPPRCASFEGYNLHAGVSVQASDRDALVRLLRYTLRPPLAKGRLSEAPEGTVVLELKRAWSDGTWQVSFSRADFVGKLAALVPPPRANLPPAPERTEEEQATRKARKLTREPTRDTPGWADLLLRVFGEDVLVCRHCRSPLTLRAVVIHPPATTRILDGLARARPPPLFSATEGPAMHAIGSSGPPGARGGCERMRFMFPLPSPAGRLMIHHIRSPGRPLTRGTSSRLSFARTWRGHACPNESFLDPCPPEQESGAHSCAPLTSEGALCGRGSGVQALRSPSEAHPVAFDRA